MTTIGRRGWRNASGCMLAARRVGGILLAGIAGSAGAVSAQNSRTAVELEGEPLRMSRVVAAALERNRDILEAQYQLAIAGEQVTEAWSRVFPSVDLSSSFTRNVAPQVSFLPAQIFDPSANEGDFIPIQFGADNLWNLSVNAEQALLEAGVFVGVGAASRFRGLQREVLRGRTQQTVTRTRIAFYDLLLAQEDVRLTENSLDRVRQSLKETRAMEAAGLVPSYDVLRLEVEVANLEPSLGRARNRLTSAKRLLATELDLDPEHDLVVAGDLSQMNLDDPGANSPANQDILSFSGVAEEEGVAPARLVGQSTALRSDLRQLELTEELRQTELRVEQLAYVPEVSAFGTYGLAAQQNGSPDFFGSSLQRGSTKQVGLRVSFSLFSGFSRDARIDQRRAALRQAETQTRLARDQAEVQVRNLLDGVQEARERAAGQRRAVSQAERGYEIVRAQYAEGLSSQLERTDAEVALRQSEFNYAQAVYDYLAARARLDEAAGKVPLVDVEAAGTGITDTGEAEGLQAWQEKPDQDENERRGNRQ